MHACLHVCLYIIYVYIINIYEYVEMFLLSSTLSIALVRDLFIFNKLKMAKIPFQIYVVDIKCRLIS